MRDHFTLVIPWTGSKDWTNLYIDYFSKILKPHADISLIQGPVNAEGKFGWLFPKLDISQRLLKAASEGRIGNRILLLDPNYINIRALRAMVGSSAEICAIINGGAFQDHDIETQFMPEYRDAIKSYELGYYSLCDKIIVPSLHARTIFLNSYPSLEKKIWTIPLPLRDIPDLRKNFNEKSGLISVGRAAFEKGSDIISENCEIQIKGLKEPEDYLQDLSKALAVIIPSRAELFGYCPIETLQCGTIPIVPNGLPYPEYIHLPDDLMLSHPVGPETSREIKAIWNRVTSMEQEEYEGIIDNAMKNLRTKLINQEKKFLECLCN